MTEKKEFKIPPWDSYFKNAWRSEFPSETEMEIVKSLSCGFGESVAIDVGAHIGLWSWSISKYLKVYSFEPDAENFNYLVENTKDVSNIHKFNIAIGADSGFCFIVPHGEEIHRNSGMKYVKFGTGDVAVLSIDSFYSNFMNSECQVKLIKIDVEGMELEVLKGAEKLLNTQHPVLVLEFNGLSEKHANVSEAEIRYFLEARNYKEFYKNGANIWFK